MFQNFRRFVGVRLLACALDVIPNDAPERLHAVRGLREMREFQRYLALLQAQGSTGAAKSFDDWRYARERFQRVGFCEHTMGYTDACVEIDGHLVRHLGPKHKARLFVLNLIGKKAVTR